MDIKSEVKKIQDRVGVEADGIFGAETMKAVADELCCPNNFITLQKKLGVEPDGILGPKTVKAILDELDMFSVPAPPHTPAKPKKKIKIALLPGHSSKDGGAEMVAGLKLSEYDFAMKFIPQVKEKLEMAGYEVVVTSRESAGGTTPMYSARAANATESDMAIEFHFNSAGKTATGSEFLYRADNELYHKAADVMGKIWSEATGLKDRGAVAVCNSADINKYKRATSRGVNAFTKANMFFCMTEPFFASNPQECDKIKELYDSGKWSSYMANTIIGACDVLFKA